ncbi:MAG TPA: hypothetical protein VGD76_00185 [Ramlibacter sp.]
MEFFNSLSLDLKILVVGIAGCALLALFSGNQKAEKRYMAVLVVLAVAGVYRFSQVSGDDPAQTSAETRPAPHTMTTPHKQAPLVSTSAR